MKKTAFAVFFITCQFMLSVYAHLCFLVQNLYRSHICLQIIKRSDTAFYKMHGRAYTVQISAKMELI